MNQTQNIYALDQEASVSNQTILKNSLYMQSPSYFDENKEVGLLLETDFKQGSSFIQPEGITNICSEITFKMQCKEVLYSIDINALVSEMDHGMKLMNYLLDRVVVQVIDLKNDILLTKNIEYVVDPTVKNQIKIHFMDSVIEEGSSYRVTIYIPTTIGHQVIYGGKDSDAYLNKYVKNQRTVTVKAIVEAYPKEDEIIHEMQQVMPVYKDKIFSEEQAILLSYTEIPRIY